MPALLAAVIAAGVVGTVHATPAFADSVVTTTTTTALAASMRESVFQMSYNSALPSEVRDAAYVAVAANDEAKIREFVLVGYRKAKDRATAREKLDSDVIREINRTAVPGSEVQGSSAEALRSSATARQEYLHSGHDRAVELDRVHDNKRQENLARLAEEDRAYVTHLAANDPGVQVRAAAVRALSGGDDRSIGLFFAYEWKIAAEIDTERFVRTTTELNQVWLDRIAHLTASAVAAEKAEREASGELARKHRLEAKQAWEDIDREADQSSVDWLAEKAKADRQAAMWAQVAEYARAAQSDQDWTTILQEALDGRRSWEDVAGQAASSATHWQAVAKHAREAAKDAADRDLGDR
ncbi:hypothetical protein BBK82_18230 [Lentzea guizhouensis]|uniref:DUF5667 domain-containing protein n=1 Tax=Lentzea guizhouensis TaxID=1586287 RepID=A0A1B2HJ06_9PSEU|nr:hypothetical protein [Lentzea guizhouensis]ANZ37706.1 hypothetical protein BBK82_18230 [Lentzea guizhouensis]